MSEPASIGKRSDKNVGNRVIKGAALMATARVAVRLISFVNLLVLARLLNPHDYGIAALAISTITLLQSLSDVRVQAAIVNLRDISDTHLDTGFTLTLMRGLLLGVVLLLFAQVFADFSRSPDLAGPLRALAIVPVLDGLRNPSFILFQRNIDFSKEFWRTTISAAIGSVAVIAAAFLLRNYWAIIVGTIAMRGAQSALTYWRVPVRMRLSLDGWREFASFGGWLTAAGILDNLRTNTGPNYLFGRYLGSGALGVFSIANTLATLVTREISIPLSQAITPGLAAIVHDETRLRTAYRDAQSSLLGVVLPLGVGTAVLAREFIILLAGIKWVGGAGVVQILAPPMALSLMTAGTSAIAQATGRTKLFFERNLVVTLITVPLLWVASTRGTLLLATAAVSVGVMVELLLNLRMAARLVDIPLLDPVTGNWRSFLAVSLMALAVWLTGHPAATQSMPLALALLPRVVLGAVVYVGSLYLLWRLSGRPTGFETKMMDIIGPHLPAALRPAFHAVRYPAR